MVRNVADGVGAARARARVHAAIVDARLVRATLRVHRALGPAANVRIAKVAADARTDGIITDGVGAARRRVARIVGGPRFVALDDLDALRERVAGEVRPARADRDVVLDAALGVEAARAFARVAAALGDARLVRRTVRVDDALGPAVGRRAKVVGQARARRAVADGTALGVQAARRRIARVDTFGGGFVAWRRRLAPHKRIADQIGRAAADRIVVDHLAVGGDAARAGARVGALEFVARLVGRALGVDGAFGLAVGRRADVLVDARADGDAVSFVAAAVRAARAGPAHVDDGDHGDGFVALRLARGERIAGVAGPADAGGHVVDRQALGVQAAHAGTRVFAAVPDAGLVGRAVRAEHALGPAAFVRIALVVFDAAARADAVSFEALGVGAARRRLARVNLLVLFDHALDERVAGERRRARARNGVADDVALGVAAARAGARVLALVVDAGRLRRAVGVDDTLGPAIWRRANVAEHALARRRRPVGPAQRVGAAWRRMAGVARRFVALDARRRQRLAALERIAGVAGLAAADGAVVEDLAAGVDAAGAGARVDAFVVDAGVRWGAL